MKRFVILLILLFVLLISACNRDRGEKDAMKYYDMAWQYYLDKNLYNAEVTLDSLEIQFPSASKARVRATKLRRTIEKDRSTNSIDSLAAVINEYKRKLLVMERESVDQVEIKEMENMIDSLERQKAPFKEIYNRITTEELKNDACRQCVIHMQNVR